MRFREIITEGFNTNSWWHPAQGFIDLERGRHHTEAIADNPQQFGVAPDLVDRETRDPKYQDDHNEPMLRAAMMNGWVRIGYGGEDVHVWRDLRLARGAIKAILDTRQPQRLFLDVDGPDGTKSYRLEPSQIEQFVKTGRLPPSL